MKKSELEELIKHCIQLVAHNELKEFIEVRVNMEIEHSMSQLRHMSYALQLATKELQKAREKDERRENRSEKAKRRPKKKRI